jgi:hypothetical protein
VMVGWSLARFGITISNYNSFIFPNLFTILRHVSDTIIHENNRCSDNYSDNSFVYTYNNSPTRSQPIRELSACRIYFRRGLTFFIEQYQKNQEKVRNRPKLSIRYEPESSTDTYTPEATIYLNPTYDTKGHKIQEYLQRKYLKIAVENTGGGVAEDCKATLRVLNFNPSNARHPSKDPKTLLWDTDEITLDIGINGFAMLYIVLSDIGLLSSHLEQVGDSILPHFTQKFELVGLEFPHLEQVTWIDSLVEWKMLTLLWTLSRS